MPLSPVSVVVGTTIATAIVVIGTGYAFKKFIYDPHLSHHIEALITHHQHHTQTRIPIPVESESDVPFKGVSTSYKDHHTSLRRRHISSHDDQTSYELKERSLAEQETYGGASTFGLDESRLTLKSDRLIDLELEGDHRSESPQEREIQEIIFSLTPTPLRSTSSTPLQQSGHVTPETRNPFISPEERSTPHAQADPRTSSTSFSFLSLSQASSPEPVPRPTLIHQSRGDSEEEEGTPTLADDDEGEILSFSDITSNATYEDAESYTPISRSLSRTSDSNANHSDPSNGIVGDMGLSYIPISVPTTRGPMSVISVDESVGESDWDVLSEAER
ncbi:hypothetical protein I302_100490 [Kwoniella bestiolae CBS 10118]|uniref:Uncharacterized protein n=1 Tax=Kwoniella bestiolae CBS 10118 TaxID=1296100 RepID=A0A1B9G584_9TREE|nr:hypothetical protein I302_03863 [Kwoniella bestiolae CBS 10118]OCF26185.1 hypothetical protein I302_03863 [Kwoniella bestiolae CBS 10118]